MKRALLLLLLTAAPLGAQQLDVFDPDDFVDPHLTRGRIIVSSRLVAGASRGYADQYRPARQDVGFLHLVTTLYWSGFQFSIKQSELRGENGDRPLDPRPAGRGAMLFPEEERREAPPQPGSKTLVQVNRYQTFGHRAAIRYRAAWARQDELPESAAPRAGLADHDTTRLLQVDGALFVRGRRLFASVAYTQLTRESTFAGSTQETLVAGTTLPLLRIGPAVLTPRVRVGGVLDTGPLIDLVNPSFDLSWRAPHTGGTTLHVVYSPIYRNGVAGNAVHHQVALYADRALLIAALGGKR
jgi:hypothetical protein